MKTLKKSKASAVVHTPQQQHQAVVDLHVRLTRARAILLSMAMIGCAAPQAARALDDVTQQAGQQVSFGSETASPDARQVADWAVNSGDNHGLPFVIVDKTNGKVFVFHAEGRLMGAAAALLGLAIGDDSVPGIGDRPLSTIRPEERTTPAGRFEAAMDRNLGGKEILWVDYANAISLHAVITSNKKEQRAERLTSPSPLDNRISYGCINVPVDFFSRVVSPAFKGTNGIVYVLPETRAANQVFALGNSQATDLLQAASKSPPVQMSAKASP